MRVYGLQAWGIHQWDIGNIGEAFRYLSQSERTLLTDLARHDEDPVRRDLKLLMTGLLAETTALHGDVDAARALLDTLEAAAGDDPYRITVWATIAARIAAVVSDPALAPYALLGEMLLAAGSTDEASVALDRADFYLDTYGQRYPRVCSCCCGRGCCRHAASPPRSSGPPPKELARCPPNARRTCSSVGPKSS